MLEILEFYKKQPIFGLSLSISLCLCIFILIRHKLFLLKLSKRYKELALNENNRASIKGIIPNTLEIELKEQLPEWFLYEKAYFNIGNPLRELSEKTLTTKLGIDCSETFSVMKYNAEVFGEFVAYICEFGVTKEVSLIFLQNDALLRKMVQDIETHPKGVSNVLLHLHIKMVNELATINKQLEDAMNKHINLIKENYLIEEKRLRHDTQEIIKSRQN